MFILKYFQTQNNAKNNITKKELARLWKKLNDVEKEKYRQIRAQKKEQFEIERKKYENSKACKKYLEQFRIWKEQNPESVKGKENGLKQKKITLKLKMNKKKKKTDNFMQKKRISASQKEDIENQGKNEQDPEKPGI